LGPAEDETFGGLEEHGIGISGVVGQEAVA